MTYTFSDLLAEARKLAQEKTWKTGYKTFWENVEKGRLPQQYFQSFVKELVHYHENFVAFGSSILHHVNFDLMVLLSNYYMQMTRLNLRVLKSEKEDLLHLPATEALCNMFLVQAETNPVSYLILHEVFVEYALPKKDWTIVLKGLQIDPEIEQSFVSFLDVLYNRRVTPEHINKHVAVRSSDRIDVLNNTVIMLDTVDYLFDEILSEYKRFTISDLELI
ncbi:hypothetical protein [Brevibacillus gelatini]